MLEARRLPSETQCTCVRSYWAPNKTKARPFGVKKKGRSLSQQLALAKVNKKKGERKRGRKQAFLFLSQEETPRPPRCMLGWQGGE